MGLLLRETEALVFIEFFWTDIQTSNYELPKRVRDFGNEAIKGRFDRRQGE